MEAVIILLVWFSTIYKQNIFSLVLFVTLVFYSFQRDAGNLVIVRYTVVIIFAIEYWVMLLNISSYNSPRDFPDSLLLNPNAPDDPT